MVQYPCSICGKQYKRLGNLRRHRLVCELLCRSVDVQENEQEDVSDCPSRFEMWKIIKIQAVQLEKLQKELHSLKQSGLRVQRKIKVLEWLNQKAKPKLSYSKWIETFTLTNKHLQMIFDTDFIKGFINILQSIILIDNVDTSPLCAFCHKNNILYYFDDEKWSVMQFSIFKTLINTLYQELLVYFSVWYKQNQNKFESLDSSPKWQENLRKFMGSGKERDESIQYIKKGFYKNLKVPFSSVC